MKDFKLYIHFFTGIQERDLFTLVLIDGFISADFLYGLEGVQSSRRPKENRDESHPVADCLDRQLLGEGRRQRAGVGGGRSLGGVIISKHFGFSKTPLKSGARFYFLIGESPKK